MIKTPHCPTRKFDLTCGVCRALTIATSIAIGSSTLFAQDLPRSNPLASIGEPPGSLGFKRRIAGGPVGDEYFQAVRFVLPKGSAVGSDAAESCEAFENAVFGIQVGKPYRFTISQVPLLEDFPLYPSVELVDRTYPPAGMEARFAIPIELTIEDLRAATNGNYVERVIYVEDPDMALPIQLSGRSKQSVYDVDVEEDPLAHAHAMGRPVAIVRLGSKGPDPLGNNSAFYFGSPPVTRLSRIDERTYEGPSYSVSNRPQLTRR